ncbi:MAG: carbohydrate ABC transporter permease [Hyphomicrobiales bacterium]|nr:carbohydrate ABC transporter permease [Hyphomicrobiales bacterium]
MYGKFSRFEITLRMGVLCLFFLFFMFPFYWLIATSLKKDVDTFAMPPLWVFTPTFENYEAVVLETDFLQQTTNSLIASLLNVALCILLAMPAAYSMSRHGTGGKNLLFWFLSIRMIPPIVGAIPLFVLAAQMRLVDTHFILPVLYLIINMPFAVWMLKMFIDEIPREIDESALIDGCSVLGIIRRIILPLVKPGLVATAVFLFIMAWNEFLIANIFTRRDAVTLPVGIAKFITEKQILWGYITAAATLASVPPIVFLWIFQRNILRGLTMGAIR